MSKKVHSDLDFGGIARGVNHPDPVNAQDVATKAYVDRNDGVSNVQLANMVPGTVKGRRVDDPTGDPVDLTGSEQGENLRLGITQAFSLAPGIYDDRPIDARTKVYRVNPTSDADVVFTGFALGSDNTDGFFLLVKLGSDGRVVVRDDDGVSSLPANRFQGAAGNDLVLDQQDSAVWLYYAAGRWSAAGSQKLTHSTMWLEPAGDMGVIDISTLESGGSVTLQPTANWSCDGFTAKPQGFWFDLIDRTNIPGLVGTIKHETGSASTQRVQVPGAAALTFTTAESVRLKYSISRWRVVGRSARGAMLTDGNKGNITVSGSGGTWIIDDNAVTNAKLENMSAARIKGRALGAGTGPVQDLTQTQLGEMFRLVSASQQNLEPGPYNDFAIPEGIKLVRIGVLNNGDVEITGIALGSSNSGGWLRFFNQSTSGTRRVVFKHGDARSLGGNQMVLPDGLDFILERFGDAVDFQYIGGRWQVVGHLIGTTKLVDNAVTNTKLADVPSPSLKGRTTATMGDPENLTLVDSPTIRWNTATGGSISLESASVATDSIVDNVSGASASPTGRAYTSLVNAETSLAYNATSKRIDYVGSSVTSVLNVAGAMGVVDIAALPCGGALSCIATADFAIDGFSVKPDGFWFDLFYRQTTTYVGTLNENVGATTTSIRNPLSRALSFTTNMCVRMRYHATRWFSAPMALGSELIVRESAAGATLAAGQGQFFAKNDSPNTPYFRDDTNADRRIVTAPVPYADLTTISPARVLGLPVTASGSGAPTELTGSDLAALVRKDGVLLITVAVEGDVTITLEPTTTVVIINVTASTPATTVRQIVGGSEGRCVTIECFMGGEGVVRLKHVSGLGAPGVDFTLPESMDVVLRNRAQATVRQRAGFWRLESTSTGIVHLVGERSDGVPLTAGQGQFWVKNDSPNNPYFRDDTNNNRKLVTAPVPLADMATIDAGRVLGNPITASGAAVPAALTPAQVAKIVDGQAITWSALQSFGGGIAASGLQTESAVGTLDVTLAATTTRLFLSSTGDFVLNSISGAGTGGRILFVDHVRASGTGVGTVVNASATAPSGGVIFCPDSANFPLFHRHGMLLVARDGAWRVIASTPTRFAPCVEAEEVGAGPHNDYAFGTATHVMCTHAAGVFTGATQGVPGQILVFSHQGNGYTEFQHNATGSATVNRFFNGRVGKNLRIFDNEVAVYQALDTAATTTTQVRWVLIAPSFPFAQASDAATGDVLAFDGTNWVPVAGGNNANVVLRGNATFGVVPNAGLQVGPVGTVKGLQVDGTSLSPVDLTGSEQGENLRLGMREDLSRAPGAYPDLPVDVRTKVLRITPTSDGDVVLTGFALGTNNTDGVFLLVKLGAGRVVLRNEDASSSAINRIVTPLGQDYVLDQVLSSVWVFHQAGRWSVAAQQPYTASFINLTPAGAVGSVDISTLQHGGIVMLQPTADFNISGFTSTPLKPGGFTFDLLYRDATTYVGTLNDEVVATPAGDRINNPGSVNLTFTRRDAVRLRFASNRWKVMSTSQGTWLTLTESASGTTLAAGQAQFFAKNDTPNNPYFRDDTNSDRKIVTAPVPLADMAAISPARVLGNPSTASGSAVPVALTGGQIGEILRLATGLTESLAPGQYDNYPLAAELSHWRINPSATGDVVITGVLLGTSNTGGWLRIFNQGASGSRRIILKHSDVASEAGNRFILPDGQDWILERSADAVDIKYIGGRWQVVGHLINTTKLVDNAVTDEKLKDMPDATVKGRGLGAGEGDPQNLTGSDLAQIVRFSNVVTEATGGTLDNYNLSATADVLCVTATSVISGVANGVLGRRLVILNGAAAGSGVTVDLLQFQISSSVNSFLLPKAQNVRLYPGDEMEFLYGPAGSRWCALESGHTLFRANSSGLGYARGRLNFVNSTSAAFGFADVSANDEVTVTVERSALTGDVTAAANSNATTIANDVVTNAKLENMVGGTVKGRAEGAATGDPQNLNGRQLGELLRIDTRVDDTSTSGSAAPYAVAAHVNWVRFTGLTGTFTVDGCDAATNGKLIIWHVEPGLTGKLVLTHSSSLPTSQRFFCPGGANLTLGSGDSAITIYTSVRHRVVAVSRGGFALTDGDKGDITVSASGTTWTIDNDAVTDAKLKDMPDGTIKGRVLGGGAGDPSDLTGTQVGGISRWPSVGYTLEGGVPQNDLAIAADAKVVDIGRSGSGDVIITGFAVGTSNVGAHFFLTKFTGSFRVIIKHNDAGSLVANRVRCPGSTDFILSSEYEGVMIAWDNTRLQVITDQPYTTNQLDLAPAGPLGVIDLSPLSPGGLISLSPTADFSVDGFSIRPQGFWFDLYFRSYGVSWLGTINDEVGTNANERIRVPGAGPMTFGQLETLRFRYSNNRWRVVSRAARGLALTDGNKGDITVSESGTNWRARLAETNVTTLSPGTYDDYSVSTPVLRVYPNAAGDVIFTGFSLSGGNTGGFLRILKANTSSTTRVILRYEGTSSLTAANRIRMAGGDYILNDYEDMVDLQYVAADARWHVVARSSPTIFERSAGTTLAAGQAQFFAKNDTPNNPYFRDDANSDRKIVTAPVPFADMTSIAAGSVLGNPITASGGAVPAALTGAQLAQIIRYSNRQTESTGGALNNYALDPLVDVLSITANAVLSGMVMPTAYSGRRVTVANGASGGSGIIVDILNFSGLSTGGHRIVTPKAQTLRLYPGDAVDVQHGVAGNYWSVVEASKALYRTNSAGLGVSRSRVNFVNGTSIGWNNADVAADDEVTITPNVIVDSITNALLANMDSPRLKGRTTAGSGDPEDLTLANSTSATWNTATGGAISVQRAALTGAVTAAANNNTTAFGATAAGGVLMNAGNAVAVPSFVAPTAGLQYLRRNAANTANEWGTLPAISGPTGATGFAGGAITAPFVLGAVSVATDTDPGSGNYSIDNGIHPGATVVRISDVAEDGSNWRTAFGSFGSVTNTLLGQLRIVQGNALYNYALFNVTGVTQLTGYTRLTVSFVGGGGSGGVVGTSKWLTVTLAGNVGATGSTGPTGATGAYGGAITIAYTFSTSTTDGAPGDDMLRLSSASQNASTAIRVDNTIGGAEVGHIIVETFDDSTNNPTGTIRLVARDDPTRWLLFNVTGVPAGPTGYRNITVTPVTSSHTNPFSNGQAILLCFARTGDKGATGPTGLVSDGNKGDVTVAGAGASIVINSNAVATAKLANDSVTNAKLENMGAGTVKGVAITASGTTDPANLTGLQIGELLRLDTGIQDTTATGGPPILYNLASRPEVNWVRFASIAADQYLVGCDATTPGRMVIWHVEETSTAALIFLHENGSISAAMRFVCPSLDACYVWPGETAITVYAGSRHRVIAVARNERKTGMSALTMPTSASPPSVSSGRGALWMQNTTPGQWNMTDGGGVSYPVGSLGTTTITSRESLNAVSTTLATMTLPAGYLQGGMAFQFMGHVRVQRGSTATATTVTLEFVAGGTQRLAVSGPLSTASGFEGQGKIEGYFHVLGPPVSFTRFAVVGSGYHSFSSAVTTFEYPIPDGSMSMLMTVPVTLEVRVGMSVAVSSAIYVPMTACIRRVT